MDYKQIFNPKTLEKLNKQSAENLRKMLGGKSIVQAVMSSQKLLSEIEKIEEPYRPQLEKLAVKIIKELYPVIEDMGIILDARILDSEDMSKTLDEAETNKALSPEGRRRIINSISHGAALKGTFAFYLFKEHLDEIKIDALPGDF